MLDSALHRLLHPTTTRLAQTLHHRGVRANHLTWMGGALGLVASFSIANEAYYTGAAIGIVSRICDALDGAVARQTEATDQGGFLDICLDFLFYASVPLAFAYADPAHNALAAATLLAAFVGTASSFLAFAVIAAKRQWHSLAWPEKSFYFLGGLTEATETLLFFAAMCLWPKKFSTLAYGFAAMCAVTITTRIWWGWRAFAKPQQKGTPE